MLESIQSRFELSIHLSVNFFSPEPLSRDLLREKMYRTVWKIQILLTDAFFFAGLIFGGAYFSPEGAHKA